MATTATLSKARSTPDRRAYEITAPADEDVSVTLPNDFGSADVTVQIEPAGRGIPSDYAASRWRISDQTTNEEIVLVKSPAKGSGSPVPQAVVFVPVKGAAAAEPAAETAQPAAPKKTSTKKKK